MKKILNGSLLLLICFTMSACDSPGDKEYDMGNKKRKDALQMEDGEEKTTLLKESLKHIEAALEFEPERSRYYRKCAQLYKDLGDYDNEITSYLKAIHYEPDEGKNYYKLMRAYVRANRFDEAETFYNDSIKLDIVKRDAGVKLEIDNTRNYLDEARKAYQDMKAGEKKEKDSGEVDTKKPDGEKKEEEKKPIVSPK